MVRQEEFVVSLANLREVRSNRGDDLAGRVYFTDTILIFSQTLISPKIDTSILLGTLDKAYETLRDLAIESGASNSIELIQMREKDRTIMFGLPGTLENVENGSFPPPPPAPEEDESAAY